MGTPTSSSTTAWRRGGLDGPMKSIESCRTSPDSRGSREIILVTGSPRLSRREKMQTQIGNGRNQKRVALVLGTRPEIIKMSPVIKAMQASEMDFFVLHTGQHYSFNMDRVFFDELHIPEPKYNLGAGSGSHAEEVGKMMIGIERVLKKENPDMVLVEGDTNTVLAAALVASKLATELGHVEAGLRSYDRTMPEEVNRVVTDHLSDYLFAPTQTSKLN